jgi:hypothetical protein
MSKPSPIVLFTLLLLLAATALAQTPDWVKNNGKSGRFTTPAYITGYGMALRQNGDTGQETTDKAFEIARKSLIEQVAVSIRSVTQMTVTDRRADETFNVATQSYSSLDLEGLQRESHFDKNKGYGYAFAYVERDKLVRLYADRTQKLMAEAATNYKNAQTSDSSGNKVKALNEYLDALGTLHKLDEATTILRALGGSDNNTGTLSINLVREKINALYNKPVNNLDDLGFFIAFCVKSVIKDIQGNAVVMPLTYQDTKFTSMFSRYFQSNMESKLGEVTNLRIITPRANGTGTEALDSDGADAVLVGSYWEMGDNVKVIYTLRKVRDGKIIASAEKTIPAAMITAANLEIKPKNLKEALQEQKEFTKDETADNSGLNIEVWTNHGDENVTYTRGDTMAVYVRVNIPCYVRLVYHNADKQRVLLLNNYYIDASKVNKIVRVPGTFECSEPFGAEVLQAIASAQLNPPLNIKQQDGFDFIVDDLPQFMAAARGMKKRENSEGIPNAEKRIVLTTLDR